MKHFAVYTGPTIVKQIADMLRGYGFNVTYEGTEHVYVQGLNTFHILSALGQGFSEKDFRQISKNVFE